MNCVAAVTCTWCGFQDVVPPDGGVGAGGDSCDTLSTAAAAPVRGDESDLRAAGLPKQAANNPITDYSGGRHMLIGLCCTRLALVYVCLQLAWQGQTTDYGDLQLLNSSGMCRIDTILQILMKYLQVSYLLINLIEGIYINRRTGCSAKPRAEKYSPEVAYLRWAAPPYAYACGCVLAYADKRHTNLLN